MAVRRELLLIIGLILVIAVLIKLIEFFQVNVVEADASKFVQEDLRTKYPGADIEIMTIIQRTNANGARYFEVKARVTEGNNTPCPERSHIFYNYPTQNFVPQLPEIIASDCAVCTEAVCTIAFPEEAIIASHTLAGTQKASDYLAQYKNATPTVSENAGGDSWLVTWDSSDAVSYITVSVHRNGTILEVKETPKS